MKLKSNTPFPRGLQRCNLIQSSRLRPSARNNTENPTFLLFPSYPIFQKHVVARPAWCASSQEKALPSSFILENLHLLIHMYALSRHERVCKKILGHSLAHEGHDSSRKRGFLCPTVAAFTQLLFEPYKAG